jgi:hypothetical protein
MHILGSPDFSALEPEMPAVFGHLPHHFYVGFMGGPIDEKSGLGLRSRATPWSRSASTGKTIFWDPALGVFRPAAPRVL